MSDAALRTSMRLSLRAPAGSHDLVVEPLAAAGDLLVPVVVAGLGLDAGHGAALLTRDGRVLDPATPLIDQGVQDGDLLVVAPTGSASGSRRRSGRLRRRSTDADTQQASRPRLGLRARQVLFAVGALGVLAAAALAVLSGGTTGTSSGDSDGALAAPLLLLALSAVGAIAAPATRVGDAVRILAPVTGGLAVLALVIGPEPGAALLAVTAAGVLAAVLAAAARATGRGGRAPLLALLVIASVLAALACLTLVRGAPGYVPWALLAGAVLPVVRLLPTQLVDFPDEMLLEIDRLSVSAWSARDHGAVGGGARARRRRRRIRKREVMGVVERSQQMYSWGTALVAAGGAVAAVVVAASAVALSGSPASRPVGGEGWWLQQLGALGLLACLAVGQALGARPVRDVVARTALRASAAVCAVAFVWVLLAHASATVRFVAALTLAVAGLVALVVSLAVGRDWRSVRWARVADLLEGAAVVLSMPAGLLAAGFVEQVRQLVS
ncbi:MAG TPA: hypothetical protein VFX33_12415 [Actinomycetales bacterium]|nr:hypothetical protein [Actinomycetales bacterium]